MPRPSGRPRSSASVVAQLVLEGGLDAEALLLEERAPALVGLVEQALADPAVDVAAGGAQLGGGLDRAAQGRAVVGVAGHRKNLGDHSPLCLHHQKNIIKWIV